VNFILFIGWRPMERAHCLHINMSKLKKQAKEESSSDSDENEEVDTYQLDDFVVADDIEDDKPHKKSGKKAKKARAPRRNRIRKIDPEDLSLIEENLDLPSRTFPVEDERRDSDILPTKRQKVAEESDSSDNDFIDKELEPGEIPETSDNLSLAAMIFGPEILSHEQTVEPQNEVFEPSELKENYATSEDQVIRDADLPERYQRRQKVMEESSNFFGREGPTEEELRQEIEWMYTRIHNPKQQVTEVQLKDAIGLFLKLLRVDKFEVPFIMLYRKHLFHPGLEDNSDFWLLYRMDIEWAHIYSSTLQCAALLDRACRNTSDQLRGRTLTKGERILIRPEIPEEVQKLLHNISADQYRAQLNDLQRFLDVHTAQVQSEKMRFSTSFLVEARRNRLQEFVTKCGLSPKELGQNLEKREVINKPVTPKVRPQELAFDLISYAYTDEMKVINAACQLAKMELLTWPTFRQYVKKEYLKEVRIFTSPTVKGKTTLDVFHSLYRVKNLERGKSPNSFSGELWGEALRCEQLGLIEITFKLPWSQSEDDRILSQMKAFYLGDQDNEYESDWNRFRSEVVNLAVNDTYAELANETRKELTVKAEEFIMDKSEAVFRVMISKAPIPHREDEDRRLFALVTDPDATSFGQTALVVLDGNGEVVETQLFNTLTARKLDNMHEADRQRSQNERRTLQRLVLDQHPRTIVLAANCTHVLHIRKLIYDLSKVLTLTEFDEGALDWQVDRSLLLKEQPNVMMADPQVAKVFSMSSRSKRMLPNFNTHLRQAVSLGRYVQNPLAEILGLWADPNEQSILQLKFHPLQKVVPDKQLLQRLECVAIEISCLCGAEVNRMVAHPHLRPPLSFISGLGQVKAHSLIEAVSKAGGKLNFRFELPGKKMIGKMVYENCAGFIIIRNADGSEEPLDRTRIHPENYELATNVAASAMEIQKQDETIVELAMSSGSLGERIKNLDLQIYASHLEKKGRKNMLEVLEFIGQELVRPFAIDLPELKDLDARQLLYLCSGESTDSLKKGSIVQAIVIGFDEKRSRLRCRLESGLEAFAESTEMPESVNPAEMRKGTTVTARVLEIGGVTYESRDVVFRVRLSLKVDDLTTHDRFVRWDLDEAFVRDDSDWIDKLRMEDRSTEVQKYVPRIVNHPRYKNVSLPTACEDLAKQEIGDCIFRPSSKGQDHLTCTFKFYDFVFAHLDVIEEGKPAVNMLGTRFRINTDTYDSLQEILERYINPVAKLTREALGHPKFKDCISGGLEFIENSLRGEKRTQQNSIPYYFTILPQYPQYFVLNYLPKDRIVREYIKVKPKGLFFHEAYHPSINFLISWFKRHYNDKNYQSQLARSKPPTMDTKALRPPENPATPSQGEFPPPTPQGDYRPRPQAATETPFNRTPHIGYQEWSGGQQLSATPRADDWNLSRTFESAEERAQPQKPEGDWGTQKEQPKETAGEWGAPQKAASDWGGAPKAGNDWGAQSGGSGDWGSQTGQSDWGGGGEFAKPSSPRGGRGGRGGRGRGGAPREGGGGRGCHNCGEEGHFARECPTKSDRPQSKGCHSCGEEGHFARECPTKADRPQSKGCHNCGEEGHFARECPTKGSRPMKCFKCNEEGHMSRECPQSGGAPPRRRTEESGGSWGGGDSSSSWGAAPSGGSSSWGGATESASTWGAPASSEPASSWGASSAPTNSWGAPPESAPAPSSSSWGAPPESAPAPSSSSWGAPPESAPASSASSWGAPTESAPAPSSSSWGAPPESAPAPSSSSWGQPAESKPAESSWGSKSSW
jgi:transcription elongation factor SPT6